MEIGKLRLQLDMIMGVAADIAGAARSGADIVQRLFHRGDHLGMLSHGEIIVGTPDGDRSRAIVAGKAARIGICALVAKRPEEHTSELQSLMRISYAVFCLTHKSLSTPNRHTLHRRPT